MKKQLILSVLILSLLSAHATFAANNYTQKLSSQMPTQKLQSQLVTLAGKSPYNIRPSVETKDIIENLENSSTRNKSLIDDVSTIFMFAGIGAMAGAMYLPSNKQLNISSVKKMFTVTTCIFSGFVYTTLSALAKKHSESSTQLKQKQNESAEPIIKCLQDKLNNEINSRSNKSVTAEHVMQEQKQAPLFTRENYCPDSDSKTDSSNEYENNDNSEYENSVAQSNLNLCKDYLARIKKQKEDQSREDNPSYKPSENRKNKQPNPPKPPFMHQSEIYVAAGIFGIIGMFPWIAKPLISCLAKVCFYESA